MGKPGEPQFARCPEPRNDTGFCTARRRRGFTEQHIAALAEARRRAGDLLWSSVVLFVLAMAAPAAADPTLPGRPPCWGMMHHVTHNRDYKTFRVFRSAILTLLRRTIRKKWHLFRDRIIDNFRVISPGDFRVIA